MDFLELQPSSNCNYTPIMIGIRYPCCEVIYICVCVFKSQTDGIGP